MEIRNKLESIKKITELNLNKFPEQLFRNNEETKVKKFLEIYPANYYAIRDKSNSGGIFKIKVDYNVDKLTRSEASRIIAQILAEYGR